MADAKAEATTINLEFSCLGFLGFSLCLSLFFFSYYLLIYLLLSLQGEAMVEIIIF